MKPSMSTVEVRKKRRKCLNRKESQGNDKASLYHCNWTHFIILNELTVQLPALWRNCFMSTPEFQEIFKCLKSALTSSFFFILWKISIKHSPPLDPFIQWCFPEIALFLLPYHVAVCRAVWFWIWGACRRHCCSGRHGQYVLCSV